MGDYNNGNSTESVGQIKQQHRVANGSNGEVTLEDALVVLMDRTGYSMVQENGQRKLGGPPPFWTGPAPPKGSEIFVGKIPRDVFEDELFPVFQQIGQIYEMRLMMDFSGTNRGYAFVSYTNIEDAKKAINQLNNYQIRRGKYLGVIKSVDNCRLFVGFIPKSKTKEEIFEEISKVTEGVVDVILYNSPRDKAKNRGFAFVEYDSHRAAAIARRKLLPGRILLWNQQIQVDWAEPEPEVDEDIMATVKVLYVRNLMETTTEESIRKLFENGHPKSVEKVKKMRDFAFVHFASREEAEEAKAKLNNTDLDGSEIVVTWAKPIDRSNRGMGNRRGGQFNNVNNSYHGNSPIRFPVPYSAGMDPSAVPFGMAQAGHIITYQPPGAGGRGSGGGMYGLKSPSPRGRGRGAAGMRGGRGYYGGSGGGGHGGIARHPEFRYFDLPHGIPFLPTNPMPLMRPLKAPFQLLAEICQKNGLGEPQYQVLPCDGPNAQLFQCKVIIPQWGDYTTPRPLRSADEAKHFAAQGVLMQINSPWEDVGSSECSSLSPSNSASPNRSRRSPSMQMSESLAYNDKYNDQEFQPVVNDRFTMRNEMPAFYELPQAATMYALSGGPPVGPTPNF